ncbi:MAG: Gfo/Idh/MocA family oxidoreductase [Rhizobiales bacterium]|nr:Gfo/Idh/MocA family oxidoreductase [Hyphomicrobiales bacterium]
MARLSVPVRIAVVGAGYFGSFHYDAWSRMPEVELVGICAQSMSRSGPLAEQYGSAGAPLPVFMDAARMVSVCQPDLVDITAPPEAHLDLIRTLAPHVGHIICQKPFCGGLEGAREAIDVCAQHGARIAVHEDVRFQPWYGEIKRLLVERILGDLYQVTFRLRPGDGQGPDAYLDRQPYFQEMPRLLVHETAIHWIDTFRYLMGEATGVYAQLLRLNPAVAGEDAGIILFDFDSGARGVFDGNRLSDHIADNRRRTMGELTIEGSNGTLRLDGDARLWRRTFGGNEETEHTYDWSDHLFGGDCVYACNRHILGAWMAGEDADTEASAYIRNQIIQEAVYESAETGRKLSV